MKKRKQINNRLVEWIINKVKTEYADDISLVLIYGSYINGTANSKSDVDCYYIPKTNRGYNFAINFIIDNVGYDIFPISWERITKIADLQESLSPLINDVKIIYYNNSSDLEHFQTLQARFKNNLFNKEYVKEISIRKCEEANKMCSMMNLSNKTSEIRKIAGQIMMTLADAIAIYNNDYYHFGLKKQFEDLQNNFTDLPQDIVTRYKNIVEAIDINNVKKHTMKLFNDVCEYLNIKFFPQEVSVNEILSTSKIDTLYLAGLYQEIKSTFNKIYVCCENNNYILAFLSAVCLQQDLDEAIEAGCPIYDLLSSFNYKDLHKFAIATQNIEDSFVKLITKNGGYIKKYDSFEQFELANL